MSDLPVARSYPGILGGLISTFVSRYGIPALKPASALLSIFEAVAQSDLRTAQDVWEALDARSLDDATGDALDALGADEETPRQQQAAAYTTVTVTDTAFAKVATRVHQGRPAPIVGSTSVDVTDATGFAATKSIYLGRGTANYEGPIVVNAVVNNTTYWTLTLASPTQRFHAPGESVVMAQGGNRPIAAGTAVQTPRSGIVDPIVFRVSVAQTLADGEVVLADVPVTAAKPGASANVPAGALREFASKPFATATCTNPRQVTTGRDAEEDDAYRQRIRTARLERMLGTPLAVQGAALKAVAADEGRRVTSASFVRRVGLPSLLVVDDGTGYEETSAGVAFEQLLDQASGGEQDLALRSVPVAKAHATSARQAPFPLVDGSTLKVVVGGTTYTHSFDTSTFSAPGATTAFEVVASVNVNSALGFGARTADGGTRVVLYAKDETNEGVEVVPADGEDANDVLGFPAGAVQTLYLYRNDQLLSKDGRPAVLPSNAFGIWNTFSGSQTLQVGVDGTPTLTYTFVDQDFVDAATGYNAVGKNSPQAWAKVITAKVPGVTATTDGSAVLLASNRGTAAGAAVAVAGGTLVTQRAFSVGTATGQARDYVLDRSVGQLRLQTALVAGDRLSAGSRAARAFLESPALGTVTLASAGTLWAAPDPGTGMLLTHGVNSATPLTLSVVAVHDWGYRLRLEAYPGVQPPSSVFSAVAAGDWAVLWDAALPASVRGAWRVAAVETVTWSAVPYATRLLLERRVTRSPRTGHRAGALVPVGGNLSRVLVCGGGVAPSQSLSAPTAITSTAELFDPATATWTATAAMATPRAHHSLTVLADGRALVVGGLAQDGTSLASTEIWSPSTGTWAAGPPIPLAVAHHRAVRLGDGRVLVSGGVSGSTYRLQSYLYDPTANSWSTSVPMTTARARHGAVLLSDGRVLVAGGETTGGGSVAGCEIYSPGPNSWAPTGAMPSARKSFGLGLWSTTKVVAVGDDRAGANPSTYAVYTIGSSTWGADTALGAVYANKQVVTLQGGDVLAPFGKTGGGSPIVRRFNGTTWSTAASPLYVDSPSLDEVAITLLYDSGPTVLNQVLCVGGMDPLRRQPTAVVERYDGTGDAWSRPDPASQSLTLPASGLAFARTPRWLVPLTIPAGTNYTASSLAAVLDGHPGLAATTYRTSRVRLSTTSYALGRGLLLAAADTQGQLAQLTPGTVSNLVGHAGSVETASAFTTPSFRLFRFCEEVPSTDPADAVTVRVNAIDLPPGGVVHLARNHADGTPGATNLRQGRNAGHETTFRTWSIEPEATYASLRDAPHGGPVPYDRAWVGAPYAVGPTDDLAVLVDGDVDVRRFVVPMYRRLTPTTGSYGAANSYRDADSGGASLAVAFGLAYTYDDHAVYMRARGKAYAADASRSMLFRYYLHGAAGERARVRVAYADAASQAVAVTVDALSGPNVDVRLKLASGAPRNLAAVRGSTRVGVAATAVASGLATVVACLGLNVASASRDGANLTTLTLDLPPGVTDSGFVAGNTLYLRSSNGNWTSGTFQVTAVGAPGGPTQTVTFTNTALGTGVVGAQVNIGTVSFDPQGEATLTGSSATTGDLFRIEASSGVSASFTGATFRSTAVAAQYLVGKAVEKTFGSPATALVWGILNDPANLKVFVNAGQTATVFAAAVNALAAADQSTCPVTVTVLGTGSGSLTTGTVEDLAASTAWVSLTDGLNYVARTVAPGTVAGDYQLTFKLPVSAGLTSGADWSNEDVRVVPVTPAAVVAWLSSPAVSGLFTAASVQRSDGGRRVQIATLTLGSAGSVQVQGGLANSGVAAVVGTGQSVAGGEMVVRVPRASAAGLLAGSWVTAVNRTPAQKVGTFTSSTVLSTWTVDGTLTLSTPVYSGLTSCPSVRLHLERQGGLMALSDPAGTNADGAVSFAGVRAGDWVRLTPATTPTSFPQMSAGNLGVFRVARVQAVGEIYGTAGAIWLENPLGVEENSECDLHTYTYDSVMPGDELTVSTDLWRTENRGTWTVVDVGAGFTDPTKLKVSITSRQVAAVTSPTAALGTAAQHVQAVEPMVATLYKRVTALSPTAGNGGFVDVHLDSDDAARLVSDTLGTQLVTVDKLRFPTTPVLGIDAYRTGTGLVGEVARVTYGAPEDPAGYPGVAAEGAKILFQGPTVRRLQVSLQVRAATGFAKDDVASQVRAAVAATVNRTPVGQPLALSEVVRAAAGVQGVTAVTILNPRYTASSDQVPVGATEKLLVLDLAGDVSVTFVAE